MAEMKFHIFKQLPDEEGVMQEYPMCWDDQAVEFDTEDAAKRFLETCKENSEHDSAFFEDATEDVPNLSTRIDEGIDAVDGKAENTKYNFDDAFARDGLCK